LIFTGREALAIDTYITSYMIKGELTVATYSSFSGRLARDYRSG